MGKFLFLILFTILTFEVNGQVPSIKGQDDTTKMYPVNYEVPGKKAIKLNSTTVLLDTDQDNLLVNGGFEAQDVTLGWEKSVNTSINFIDTNVFEGKKSRSIRFGGTVANYWAETNRPEYVGRQARVEIYYRSPITWGAEVPDICVYAGTASNIVSGTCEPLQNTGTQWYPYQKGFFWSEAVMGLVIRNNGAVDLLNSVYLDKASIQLDKNEGFVANISNDTEWTKYTPTFVGLGTVTEIDAEYRRQGPDILIRAKFKTGTPTAVAATMSLPIVNGQQVEALTSSVGNIVGESLRAANISGGGFYYPFTLLGNPQVLFMGSQQYGAPPSVGQGATLFNPNEVEFINARIPIKGWSARSQVTVFPDETFSTDINPVYWKATACGENEVGCYNTYSYAANTNTSTLCATRPTSQTDAEMRVQGIRIFPRGYTSPSTCDSPAYFQLVIGKNFSDPSISVFKNLDRLLSGTVSSSFYPAAQTGILHPYNSSRGILTLDGGGVLDGSVTSRSFIFPDGTTSNNGYLVIKASKTGLGMANVPARYPVKFIESGNNWATIYNDGWVEQRIRGVSEPVPTNGNIAQTLSLLVGMKDTSFDIVPYNTKTYDRAFIAGAAALSTTSLMVDSRNDNASSGSIHPAARVEGYGASSAVKQYGASPAY